MPFSEKIKEEVRYRSRNCCVICKKFFRPCEVHHILPEALGGPNTIENAVLLCRNHHAEFGHNSEFVDYITKEREKWYEYCERYMPNGDKINQRFEKMEAHIKSLEEQKTPSIEITKETLTTGIDTLIGNLQDIKKSLEKKEITLADISTASLYMSGQAVSTDYLGTYGLSSVNADVESSPTYSNPPSCPHCGYIFYIAITSRCPNCGEHIEDY